MTFQRLILAFLATLYLVNAEFDLTVSILNVPFLHITLYHLH